MNERRNEFKKETEKESTSRKISLKKRTTFEKENNWAGEQVKEKYERQNK